MEAIIKNGVINNGIQSCFVLGCGIEVIFHNNDLADKFANYASTNSLGNQIDIMEIANAPLREYIVHAMSYKYRNQLYQFFH